MDGMEHIKLSQHNLVHHKYHTNSLFRLFKRCGAGTSLSQPILCTTVPGSSAANRRFHITVFLPESLPRKFKFDQNLTRIAGALHEDIFTFMRISR